MDLDQLAELAQEFGELGRDLHRPGDNQAALHRMVELAVKHVPGCGWASVTILDQGHGRTVAFSDPVAIAADELQYDLTEGPCVSAAVDDDATYSMCDVMAGGRRPVAALRGRVSRADASAECAGLPAGW